MYTWLTIVFSTLSSLIDNVLRTSVACHFCVTCEAQRHRGITLSGVCLSVCSSVRLSVCLSACLVVTLSWKSRIAMFRRRYMHSWECCDYVSLRSWWRKTGERTSVTHHLFSPAFDEAGILVIVPETEAVLVCFTIPDAEGDQRRRIGFLDGIRLPVYEPTVNNTPD